MSNRAPDSGKGVAKPARRRRPAVPATPSEASPAAPAGAPTDAIGVAAVNRALTILQAFDRSVDGMTLAELATATGLYHSTILRLCESLEHFRYLKRLADGRYLLGPAPFHLGMLYQTSFRLQDHCMPLLRELSKATHETAAVYVREDGARICLYRVELPRSVRMNVREGERVELDKGAAGKVLLAFDGTVRAALEEVRARAWAISLAERDSELAAVAAPVFGTGQRLVCAISLGIPIYRFDRARFTEVLPHVMDAARRLTDDLGGDSTPLRTPHRGLRGGWPPA